MAVTLTRNATIVISSVAAAAFICILVSASMMFGRHEPVSKVTKAMPGIAKICLVSHDIKLEPNDEITLPSTTVFSDGGHNTGKIEDASSWISEVKENSLHDAALITLAPVVLRRNARCATTMVQMLTDSLKTATSQRAADNRLFDMSDVIHYPIPAMQPSVETGKLIDDGSVEAVLLSDVTQAKAAPEDTDDDATKATKCLAEAKKLAAFVGGGVGRQTSMIVSLAGVGVPKDTSFGCAFGPRHLPNLFVDWEGGAPPPMPTLTFIMQAGEYLTGATQAELRRETTACVGEALKPDAGELASREFRGVKIDCQAYGRDGGGGSVTVYRRFGSAPKHGKASKTAAAALERSSDAISRADDKRARDALGFAKWYLDPSIPTEVKTFAMLAARVLTLGERCPTAKSHDNQIAKWASDAGISNEDIQPGGRYASLMAEMMSEMRSGAAKQSVEEACNDANRYD